MRRILWCAALGVAVLSGAARGDEAEFVESRTADGGRLIRARAPIVVPGQLREPRVFYVLKRTDVEYQPEPAERTFLPRILEATGRHPF
ncbi:MAG TPA: hypothetical protein VFF06_35270 [Polyangia bacterium]|nr:hypothetical protein [Polyangia bacterium]